MFVSTRDRPQGRRRRSQTYGVNKAARSSKLSLLSALTTGSHNSRGSNDSSSTVTQESYSKASSSTSKRSKSSKHRAQREGRERRQSGSRNRPDTAVERRTMSRESVDVFAFLVQDNEPDSSKAVTTEPPALEKDSSAGDNSDAESVAQQSMHSDSGISMGDSVVQLSHDQMVNAHLPALLESTQEEAEAVVPPRDEPNHSQRMQWKWPDVPRPTHKHPLSNNPARTPSPEHVRMRLPPTPDSSERGFCSPASPLSGYDLIADKLASEELPAVFRTFRKVKFRLLLQLQDEILEMEQQLAALDTADTQSRLTSDGSPLPASRRLSWQWGQSELPAHRLHILGRLSMKLEQYYQVLTASQRVQNLSSSPKPADIERFRLWLKEHNPLTHPESRFLDDDGDLVSLTEISGMPCLSAAGTTPDFLPLCVLTMTLLPLLAFKFMTSVLNRLILLTIVLAAGLGSLEKLEGSRVEQHKQWVIACFGVSLLTAILF